MASVELSRCADMVQRSVREERGGDAEERDAATICRLFNADVKQHALMAGLGSEYFIDATATSMLKLCWLPASRLSSRVWTPAVRLLILLTGND
jgi:hypothetical protein